MTTLYREVRIESAEQAKALPVGAIATSEKYAPEVFVKDGNSWLRTHGPGSFTNVSAVGLTALVPLDAVIDHRTLWDDGQTTPGHQDDGQKQFQYVSRWVDA